MAIPSCRSTAITEQAGVVKGGVPLVLSVDSQVQLGEGWKREASEDGLNASSVVATDEHSTALARE